MKKKRHKQAGLFYPRIILAMSLCLSAILLTMFSLAAAPSKKITAKRNHVRAAVQPGGPVAPASPSPGSDILSTSHRSITYTDSTGGTPNPSAVALGKPDCTVPNSCSTFNLTIDGSVGVPGPGYNPSQNQIAISISWALSANDYDTFVEDSLGNVVAQNLSTADPEYITLPTTIAPGNYKIIAVMATGAPVPYTGSVLLQAKPAAPALCNPNTEPGGCAPPRYQNYPAGEGQADDAGEPSIGVDWNPNVPTLKNGPNPPTAGTPRVNHINLNTGGVAFFTSGAHEWRVNFDDCPSPAINIWEDVSAVTTQQFVLSDPIGFVDHYSSAPLGLTYPEPPTPGRVFTLDLIGGQGDSFGSFSDTDGNSYLPGGTGGPGQGPDHQTLGGGPYNRNSTPPPPSQVMPYGSPNAIYYCSQNIVAEAQCSRSDDGGKTFGPAVPIFNPSQCTGGIHGHVKVARDGTVYVPNSSCAVNGGTSGVAVSTDNGLTWTQNDVPGSTSTQDPSLGIGQNDVGKPANLGGTNTIYLGYVDGNGHPKIARSGDRGATWSTPADVGQPFAVEHAVFPVVVTGDDNRAAFGFLGTGPGITAPGTVGTCDPYGATLNCANIWHLYIATTYDGGTNWITVDATPNDPVQTGTVCLQGTTCAGGRNLLDFNDFGIDAEGRGVLGYADGCVRCNNAFLGQSAASHGTVSRQSGGRRLFAHFDPAEPTTPAPPQLVSALKQSPSGAVITWLQPDNGGSPITGYRIYRGTTSGAETFLASVSGEATNKYFDPAPPAGNVYYYVTAVNASGESPYCGELTLAAGPPPESECLAPGLTELTDPAGDTNATVILATTTPAPPGSDILKLSLAQPYQPDGIPRIVFTITTDNGQSPQAAGSAWYVAMKINGGYKAVRMAWKAASLPNPVFESYTPAPNGSGGVDGRFVVAASEKPLEATSHYLPPYNQVVLVAKASDLGLNPGDVIGGFVVGTEQSTNPADPGVSPGGAALFDQAPDSLAFTGMYTVENNQTCRPNTPPVAVLSANPLSGNAPLLVHFDGSGSTDPDTAPPPDTIASYHFDFGDGTNAICPGDPACTGPGKIDHTYNSTGDFPARLSVTDSRGKQSANTAEVIITVTTQGPPLTGVVSRKTHGVAPNAAVFDVVVMPQNNGKRAVECRAPGSNASHKLIFGFANTLSSVGSVSATSTAPGGGSQPVPATGQVGGDPHQYIVDVTNVPNGQYLTVTLHSVVDSASKSGDVSATMGVLAGDTNADGSVDSADISQTKTQSGTAVSSANFREDLNTDGALNSADITLSKGRSGTALPSNP